MGANISDNLFSIFNFQFYDRIYDRRRSTVGFVPGYNAPDVLKFDYKLLSNGRSLPEPVNYGLVKILPPKGVAIDNRKRPFVVN